MWLLISHCESSSQEVINKVYQEYINGNIEYAEYITILEGVKNTSGDMDESKLREGSTDNFIKYLKEHNMLDYYIVDYRGLAEQIMSIPMDHCKKMDYPKRWISI